MNNSDVWRSREAELIGMHADRLRAHEEESDDEGEGDARSARAKAAPGQAARPGATLEEIDFRYINTPPPRDLLNYKNMDLEMSLWAKTQTGWLSVGILLIVLMICFIATCLLWMFYG